jgi:hypothetical protein
MGPLVDIDEVGQKVMQRYEGADGNRHDAAGERNLPI